MFCPFVETVQRYIMCCMPRIQNHHNPNNVWLELSTYLFNSILIQLYGLNSYISTYHANNRGNYAFFNQTSTAMSRAPPKRQTLSENPCCRTINHLVPETLTLVRITHHHFHLLIFKTLTFSLSTSTRCSS